MTPVPDAGWAERMSRVLAGEERWSRTFERLGSEVSIKVKDAAGDPVFLLFQDAPGAPAVQTIQEDETPEEALRIGMGVDTWERLLSGGVDLTNALMVGDIKAKASMFKLMKIATPAEELVELLREKHKEVAA
ncbi:MAG: SCP2 sterol-binding domain-containing protein [Euryarchaeota archaeon]|nr:SCP2 sterol-binding domain-containing protein [Euryarchaeota archaeon]